MEPRSTPSNLSRLMHDLSLREGEDLQRALAESTALLARLTQGAPSRRQAGGAPSDIATLERAQQELDRIVAGELARLCRQAAAAGSWVAEGPRRAHGFALPVAPGELARLLDDELRCAEQLQCLPEAEQDRLRELCARLAAGECDRPAFRAAAEGLEARLGDLPGDLPSQAGRAAVRSRCGGRPAPPDSSAREPRSVDPEGP